MHKDKFTKGPWRAFLNHPTAAVTGHLIKADYEPYFPIVNVWEGGGTKGKPMMLANAHLIAAAPELLEAARFARCVLDAKGGHTAAERKQATSKLLAAIAKATPEA